MVEPLPRGPKALGLFLGEWKKEEKIRREGGQSGEREEEGAGEKKICLTYTEKLEHLHGPFKCEALF